MGLHRALLSSVALVCACSKSTVPLAWEVTFLNDEDRERAARVHLSILAGGCDATTAVYEASVAAGETPPAAPNLGTGTFSFAAYAVDTDCMRYAFGCTAASLPLRSEPYVVTVLLQPVQESSSCLSGCEDGLCADGGGIPDAYDGGSDAGDESPPSDAPADVQHDVIALDSSSDSAWDSTVDSSWDSPPVDSGWDSAADSSWDTGPDAGWDSASDAGSDSAVPCTCMNPLDSCSGGYCTRMDDPCGVLDPCDDGYECSGGECTCTDPEVCGPDCTADDQCIGGYECDLSASLCRYHKACLDDDGCDVGERCYYNSRWAGYCGEPLASLMTGSPCETSENCASAYCFVDWEGSGTCLDRCQRNADCSGGQRCSTLDHLGDSYRSPACIAGGSCDEPCTGDDTWCYYDTQCNAQECIRNSDCPGTGCSRAGRHDSFGPSCGGVVQCGADEFLLGEEGSGADGGTTTTAYCVTTVPCWTDGDCTDPYTCMDLQDIFYSAYGGGGFCAKLL